MTRPRKCKQCGNSYTPFNTTQKVCSPSCALEYWRIENAKRERREIKRRKVELKPKRQLMKEAQAAVNEYVRMRDYRDGCISCDKPASWIGQWHASHFKSTGSNSALRFNLWNIHKSCSICNNHLSGNIIEYEPRLIAKIGKARVDWLKVQSGPRRYSEDYLRRIAKIFRRKSRILKKRIDE